MATFLNLHAVQWIAVIIIFFMLFLLADALAGHYRTGFKLHIQYMPFAAGGVLILFLIGSVFLPLNKRITTLLKFTSWVTILAGFAGFIFHHYYGMIKKPGGYSWFLHHLMYGAPPLAPLGLSAAGLFSVVTAYAMQQETKFLGYEFSQVIFFLVGLCMSGIILQTAILHFRGAFNNPVMYIPFTFPLLTAIMLFIADFISHAWLDMVLKGLLWLTFLSGFVGLGMHLRGFDRQRAGLYVTLFNILQGPPLFAPALYSILASIALVAIYMM